MRVFLSYSQEQLTIAQTVDLALRSEGHETFFDRASLPAGEAYNRRIREGVERCDLFVFLLSPESVTPRRYSLTEMEFAQARWPSPAGHVLTVMVSATDLSVVPPYLKAVGILRPSGDVAATIAAEVARRAEPRPYRWLRRWAAPVLLVALAGGAGTAWLVHDIRERDREQQRAEVDRLDRERQQLEQTEQLERERKQREEAERLNEERQAREAAPHIGKGQAAVDGAPPLGTKQERREEAERLLRAAKLSEQTGNHAAAWDAAAKAAARTPHAPDVVATQERIGMEWLRNARVTTGKETFIGIVEKVSPVLTECASSAPSKHTADCLAHLGWADFLRSREGVAGLDPPQYYRRALEVDPDNVFAHAMWAHHLAATNGSLPEIRAHFSSALASGRERPFVRRYQLAAHLFYPSESESQNEAIRVADDMRRNREPMPAEDAHYSQRWQLWSVYWDRVINGHGRAEFLAALPPVDHVATFRWLFPADLVPEDKRTLCLFVLATLEEANGQRAEALEAYRNVSESLAREGAKGGTLVDGSAQGIDRLSRF